MNIRKFLSIFDRNKEAPVAKPKRRKAKVKAAPKKGHWKYTGPQISFGEFVHMRDNYKKVSAPKVELLTIQDLNDAHVSSSDITDPSTKPSPSYKKPSTISTAQKIMITSARYVEDAYDLARKDPKNYEWAED